MDRTPAKEPRRAAAGSRASYGLPKPMANGNGVKKAEQGRMSREYRDNLWLLTIAGLIALPAISFIFMTLLGSRIGAFILEFLMPRYP